MASLLTHRWTGQIMARWILAATTALLVSLLTVPPAHAAAGTLVGDVTRPNGEPISHFTLELWDESGTRILARHYPPASYSVNVEAGSYRVCFSKNRAWSRFCTGGVAHPTQAPLTVVSPDATTRLDIQKPRGGTVEGRVVDDTAGFPVAGVQVSVYVLSPLDGAWQFVRSNLSAESGAYRVHALPGTYRVEYSVAGHVQFHPGVPTAAAGLDVSVATRQATLLDQRVPRPGSITGTVTAAPGGRTVEDRIVTAVNLSTGKRTRTSAIRSDGPMDYSFPQLPAGQYRVEFARVSGGAFAEAQFFPNVPESEGTQAAGIVTVSQRTNTVVDATLRDGGSLTGIVAGGNGAPRGYGCYVRAWPVNRQLTSRRDTTLDQRGFAVTGLTTGTYRVGASCDGFPVRWHVGVGHPLATDRADAARVSVVAGEQTDIGTLIYPGRRIEPFKPPEIVGDPVVGQTLTMVPGEWGVPESSVTRKWVVLDHESGTSTSTTGSTFTPSDAVVGRYLLIQEYVSDPLGTGMTTSTVVEIRPGPDVPPTTSPTPSPTTQPNPSPPTPVVVTPPPPGPTGPTAIVVGKKSITVNGKAKVGSTLKAKVSGITPSGAKVTFKWYAGKKAIKKATKSKLKLTKALHGKKLVLEVTFTYPGLASVVRKVSLGKVT